MRNKLLALLLVLAALCLCTAALADGLAFRESGIQLFEGESADPTLLFTEDADPGNVKYTSSAPKIVSVDAAGHVTALRKGTATITATSKGAKKTHKAQVKVQVLRAVTSLSVDESRLKVLSADDYSLEGLLQEDTELPVLVAAVGSTVSLRATLLPKDASSLKYTAETSDPTVAVGPSGNLKILRPGECDITLHSDQNPEVSKSYHLLAVQQVSSISVDLGQDVIGVGFQTQATANILPYDATIQGVTWASLNTNIATVDENGVITGTGRGSARIRATAIDGSGVNTYVTIQVQQQPTGLTLDRNALTIFVGKSTTLKVTVQPSTASNKSVTWASSDPAVCQVNSAGKLTPIGDGECVITCESKIDPSIYATCDVRVIAPVTSIKFDASTLYIYPEEVGRLTWTVLPANATDPSVTLTNSNNSVALVTMDGMIYPQRSGQTTVTATANDGSGVKAQSKVYVTDHVNGVYLENNVIYVGVNQKSSLRAVLTPSTALNHNMTWTSSDTSVALVRGTSNNPTVYGIDWGSAVITGTTEDGGYTCSAVVRVGDFAKALAITDLYTTSNQIKISVRNNSDMNISKFSFTMECYDIYGLPLICTTTGNSSFTGSYNDLLYPYQSTTHGRFRFNRYAQPASQVFGHVIMQLTGYEAEDGFSYTWATSQRPTYEFYYDGYIGYVPTPVPTTVPVITPWVTDAPPTDPPAPGTGT